MRDHIAIGDRVTYDDNDCTVEAIGNGTVFLRSDTGVGYNLTPAAAAGAKQPSAPAPPRTVSAAAVALSSLPADVRAAAEVRLGHVLEVLTGYKSGTVDEPIAGEPRPAFNPDKWGVVARYQHKAEELEVSASAVRTWCRRYNELGARGLVDGRHARMRNPIANADPRVLEAIRAVARAGVSGSTGDRKRFRRKVINHLQENHSWGEDRLPSPRTLDVYVDYLTSGKHTFDKATTRQSQAMISPKVFTGFSVLAAGELVMIDVNRVDVLAWDPEAQRSFSVELCMALDAYTRAVLAWRFAPTGTAAEDMVMLLADMLNPLEMRPHWKDSVRYSALHVPYDRLVGIDERLALASARPVIVPETILIDNAQVNLSTSFREGCRAAQISVHRSRPAVGPDKSHVERAFGTLRTQFCQHVTGYKGNAVANRGKNVEGLWTMAELEELFAEWVVVVQLRTVNRTLTLPFAPETGLSPIEAFNESTARCGHIVVPPNPQLYFELLPQKWVKISASGVRVNKKTYTSKVLVGRDNEASGFPDAQGKWPVKYDRRDSTLVYFGDRDGTWHPLRWKHHNVDMLPFTERTYAAARRIVEDKLERRATEAEVAVELKRLQDFTDVSPTEAGRVRRRLSVDVIRGRQAAADRDRPSVVEAEPTATVLRAVDDLGPDDDLDDLNDLADLPLFGEDL